LARDAKNNKGFYRYVNQKRKLKERIAPLLNKNGDLLSTDEEKDEVRHNFFASVFTGSLSPQPSRVNGLQHGEQRGTMHYIYVIYPTKTFSLYFSSLPEKALQFFSNGFFFWLCKRLSHFFLVCKLLVPIKQLPKNGTCNEATCLLNNIRGFLKLNIFNGIITLQYKLNYYFPNTAGCLPTLAQKTKSGYTLQTALLTAYYCLQFYFNKRNKNLKLSTTWAAEQKINSTPIRSSTTWYNLEKQDI